MRTFQYHNFSLKGDSRWAGASRVTGYAPVVVCVLLGLSVVQVSLGAVWLSCLEDVSGFVPSCFYYSPCFHPFVYKLNLVLIQGPR